MGSGARFASIDVGTNTLRLLIAELSGEALVPVVYERAITRLGGGYTPEGGLAPDSQERALKALEGFRTVIDETGGVEEVYAVATSVVRRAGNRDDFTRGAGERAGITIDVITGDEEARLSLLGVRSVIESGTSPLLVMDIGGGSTEFMASGDGGIEGAWSMELGVVHLTEDHLASDPPKKAELFRVRGEVRAVLEDLTGRMKSAGVDPARFSASSGALFVGTAGTVTTLAALDQDLDEYDRDRINNYRLTRENAEVILEELASMTIEERGRILALEKGREDLIVPGALITLEVMDEFGFTEMVVSDAGLLEGVIMDRAGGRA